MGRAAAKPREGLVLSFCWHFTQQLRWPWFEAFHILNAVVPCKEAGRWKRIARACPYGAGDRCASWVSTRLPADLRRDRSSFVPSDLLCSLAGGCHILASVSKRRSSMPEPKRWCCTLRSWYVGLFGFDSKLTPIHER